MTIRRPGIFFCSEWRTKEKEMNTSYRKQTTLMQGGEGESARGRGSDDDDVEVYVPRATVWRKAEAGEAAASVSTDMLTDPGHKDAAD